MVIVGMLRSLALPDAGTPRFEGGESVEFQESVEWIRWVLTTLFSRACLARAAAGSAGFYAAAWGDDREVKTATTEDKRLCGLRSEHAALRTAPSPFAPLRVVRA